MQRGHGRSRRILIGLMVVVVACAAIYIVLGRSKGPSSLDGGPVRAPTAGAYLGTEYSAHLDRRHLIEARERSLGRKFAIDHVYHKFDEPFPDTYDRWTVQRGHVLFLSWSCRLKQGGAVDWRDIADGKQDHVIDARARALRALHVPVLVSFCHEPGTYVGASKSGDESDFRAAWQHIHDRFDSVGVHNVSWVWTLTAFALRSGTAPAYYPGDGQVDWVGVDGYTNIDCPWLSVPWTSWTDIFSSANSFAREHDKPLIVAEFSAREDTQDPSRKERWLKNSLKDMEGMSQLKAVVEFNSTESCSSYVVSSPRSAAGFKVLADSSWLSPVREPD